MPPDEFLDLVHCIDNSNHTTDSTMLIPTDSTLNLALRFVFPIVVPLRQSPRIHKPPTYLRDYHCNLVAALVLASASLSPSSDSFASSPGIFYPISFTLSYAKLFSPNRAFSMALTIHKEPDTYAQAILDSRWQDAMQAKIDALQANHTWVMTPLPPGKVPIVCKWVFKN